MSILSDDFRNEFEEHTQKQNLGEPIDDSKAKNIIFNNSMINRGFLETILDTQIEILSILKEKDVSEVAEQVLENLHKRNSAIVKRLTGEEIDKP